MWLTGNYGVIYNSTNDGLNWILNYNLFNSTMFKSVWAVDVNNVWISGNNGKILKLKTATK